MFSISTLADAQSLDDHRWNNRVLLVLAEKEDNPLVLDQIQILKEDLNGVDERKLVVYTVLPSRFKRALSAKHGWMDSGKLYNTYKDKTNKLEVILIGLDGGVKLRSEGVLDLDRLFETIDKMPMRRAEMKRQTKEN